jgi:dipeptidyl aminopeptidase/acylaminoacyl peptidase
MYGKQQVISFKSQGETIFANIGIQSEGNPCVIMSHGLEGNKDGKKWLLLASRFYGAGFAYLRFNYRGCGLNEEISEGRFEDTTLSSRIQDFRAAVDFISTTGVDRNRLAVVGSSFGGMVAIAANDNRIKAIVTLSTPYAIRIPDNDQYELYHSEKFLRLPSNRKLKKGFFTDVSNIDMGNSVKGINCPLLVIHGDADNLVPVENALNIYGKAIEPKRLEIIEGGGHSLDESNHMEQMVSLTFNWIKQYL